jgi:cell division protein FtsI (penicillin-binding protein 3)
VRLVDRRIGLLFGVFLVALFAIALRAWWLDTVKAGSLRSKALSQQTEALTLPAKRGTIFDRNGRALAISEDSATIYADPLMIKNPGAVAARLAPIVHMPPNELLAKLSDRTKGFVYLKRKMDLDVGQAVDKLKLEGVGTLIEPRRKYPQNYLASQVLGTVGTDNYGLSGLESRFDKRLHGSDGKERLVKDALGKPVSLEVTKQPVQGGDIHLTLDANLQERVETVLSGVGEQYTPKGATALVMDPRDGSILALANWPRVNANHPGRAPAYAQQNRAVTNSYEPGSTFKAFTVAGALQQGLITSNTTFYLPPEIEVADRKISDAHPRGAETLSVREILKQSSNVGAVKIGQTLGATAFDKWVRAFGFAKPTGVDLPGESPGIVLHVNQYSGSSMGNLPIGQGEAVTPIQMAAAYSAIANGGLLVRPHVVQGDPAPKRRVITARTSWAVSRMLEGVLAPGGTGSEAVVPGYALAGKTGTAQIPDKNGGYSKNRFVASFVGYAPARNARLLVAVMVNEPNGDIYGGSVAAPAFQKIVSFALPYLGIPPN